MTQALSDMARLTLVHDFLILELNGERIVLKLLPLTQTRMRAAIEKGRGPLDQLADRVMEQIEKEGIA